MENLRIEKKDFEPKVLFKAILMRHQEATYLEEGTGLTDKGVAGATKTGEEMREDDFFPNKNEIISFTSPLVRTKGTLDITGKAAVMPTVDDKVKSRVIEALRSSDFFDEEAFDKFCDEELGGEPAEIAKAFYTHDVHKNGEMIEPHFKKKKRLYRVLEYLIRE